MNDFDEFSLINQYFLKHQLKSTGVQVDTDIQVGIGDDCAVIKAKATKQLLVSTDCLVENVHFPIDTAAELIATKALAVNLSDIAAMGGIPAWFTLVLSLPSMINESWLESFSQGLFKLADQYKIPLIGGDTVRSEQLSITIQIHGYQKDNVMLRSNAKIDDLIIVTGPLGAAALGLKFVLDSPDIDHSHFSDKDKEQAVQALNQPEARVEFGQHISAYSHCAIDLSDGLLSDLGHILSSSECGAIIDIDKIPLATCLSPLIQDSTQPNKESAMLMALTGGDDYELCFTLPAEKWHELKLSYPPSEQFYVIGEITDKKGIQLMDEGQSIESLNGQAINKLNTGYNHFG